MDSELFEFNNLLRIIDALPIKKPDDTPLRELMPGAWPTLGNLRALVASQQEDAADRKRLCDCGRYLPEMCEVCLEKFQI